MKKILLLISLGLLFTQGVFANQLETTGYLQNYTGVLLQNGDYSILQNSFNLNLDYSGDKGKLHINPILYNYNSESNIDLKLKEGYIDLYFENFDLRIGKQQIIFGKADGVFITDVISPKDLTEFILPDFDEIRIGVNAAKLDYYFGDTTVETVFIPDFQGDILPASNSIWAIKKPQEFENATMDLSKMSMKNNLKNSSFAIKISSINDFLDYELISGYLWNSTPVNNISKGSSGLVVQPEYYRNKIIGGSFSKSVAGLILRGEGALYIDKALQTKNILNEGVVKKNDLNYMIGIDYNILGVNLSNQIIQEYILDYKDEDEVMQDKLKTTLTLNINDKFLRDTLFCQLFAYYNVETKDALIKTKVDYSLFDGFNIIGGGDIFVGDSGPFGQFDNNDMIYTKVKYSF
ncbi:DUF1302 family protein [Haliovirga abyssi]|uniref:DUF5723 domain-containing protein n=1 Tax=Haliovirga abyssi TaxID=2996794 RepID=A0AAU9DIB5_9FUSO|nr:DUF1302 family protein [Haliovirga abyssi]BDU51322.1 hypothetical protein HLVA_18910 [Haliovirga abyssi]